MPPPPCEHGGLWGATEHVSRAHLCTVGPAAPPRRPPGTPSASVSASPRYHGVGRGKKPGLMRGYTAPQRSYRVGEGEPSLERPPHHQKQRDWWAGGGGAGKKGLLSLGARRGPMCGQWTPCRPARPVGAGVGSGHPPSHLEMGERLVSVQK